MVMGADFTDFSAHDPARTPPIPPASRGETGAQCGVVVVFNGAKKPCPVSATHDAGTRCKIHSVSAVRPKSPYHPAPQPCEINGVHYASRSAAGRALGIAPTNVGVMIRTGRADLIGSRAHLKTRLNKREVAQFLADLGYALEQRIC